MRTCQWNIHIPHHTILPGLQFSLAGILGKPETYYKIPVIRFVFEIFSYLVMLVLFCSSVLLKEPDFIPADEVIFYVFAAGLLWREVLEFRDGIPARRLRSPHHQSTQDESAEDKPTEDQSAEGQSAEHQSTRDNKGKDPPFSHRSSAHLSCIGAGNNFNRMVSAFTRYVLLDTWNFLDAATILCILVAFIFRMIALLDSEVDLFHAQFFYALTAPLLFSRLLVLSQIDETLGPMTQVIWRLMSHTLRFSAFIAMVMLSFALAFHAVFHTCGTYVDPDGCSLDDDDPFPLRDAFGTFSDSFVTVFGSALDAFDFSVFDDVGSDCRCSLPEGARSAGISLMVVYMVTLSVVLLNLLIAVLSTEHDKVYANAEKEFHLARARLIYQSARSVECCRPPPPLNLIKVIFGVLVDTVTEVYRLFLHAKRIWYTHPKGCSAARSNKATRYRKEADALRPFSTTPKWKSFEGFLRRAAFAVTMGAASLVVFAILWSLSVPWIAWRIWCLVHPAVDDDDTNIPRREIRRWTCWKTDNDQKDKKRKRVRNFNADEEEVPLGYFYEVLQAVFSLVLLVPATMCAAVLCLCCIMGSVALWLAGVLRLLGWLQENWGKCDEYPKAMPGQEGGNHWTNAWGLAQMRNHGTLEDFKRLNFHVGPFLKSKTGLDMQHFTRLTKLRDQKSFSEKQLVQVDRELAHVPIDLEYLSSKAEKRIADKKKGRDGATGAGVGDGAGNEASGEVGGEDVERNQLATELMMMATRMAAKLMNEAQNDAPNSSAEDGPNGSVVGGASLAGAGDGAVSAAVNQRGAADHAADGKHDG